MPEQGCLVHYPHLSLEIQLTTIAWVVELNIEKPHVQDVAQRWKESDKERSNLYTVPNKGNNYKKYWGISTGLPSRINSASIN